MKRPPRYIDIMINTEIRFDTHRLLKFIRESNEYDLNTNQSSHSIDELKNRDNKIDMITDEWIINNWSKIIDQIEFLYNEWDCYYKEGKTLQGSPNTIRKRSSIYEKRMEIEKNVNQLLHEDIFTKRFKQACYTIMDKDKKKQKK
tara:strand:- start:41 stop:475 length:435 start_codon:yes stop_codon:yes gene_type:complete